MFGLKIVTEKQVSFWKSIEKDYDNKCNQYRFLKNEREDMQKFFKTLAFKLKGTGAVIHSIKQNKEGIDTCICIIDERTPKIDSREGKIYMSGNVNLFVLNKDIYPFERPGMYNDMPYLQAVFNGLDVKIDELHSDVRGEYYENHGYGTMLIETLIAIARNAGCEKIHGMLSSVDAKTEKAKEKRNSFYKNRGFSLTFSDAEEKDGCVSFIL